LKIESGKSKIENGKNSQYFFKKQLAKSFEFMNLAVDWRLPTGDCRLATADCF
jgi:hypothetical protein